MNQPDFLILADGDFPSHPIPQELLLKTKRLYCCDHAGQAALERGLKPLAIIGDGDSLTAQQKASYGSLYHQVDEQDYNDLTKAMRYALEQEPTREERLCVAILGATGKREDHTLCNIALLMWYYRRLPVLPLLYTDYGYFQPASGRTRFCCFPRQQVSIYNFGCSRLDSEGLRWQSYAYEELWQGGLNEATAREFTLDGDGYYLVYRTYEGKIGG